jgi:type II secretory pathway pseudopilin PulG
MATIIFVKAVLLILLVASVVKFVGLVIEFVIENVVVSIIIALVTLAILVVWFGYFNPKGKRERLAEEARQLAEENRRRRQELMSKYQDEEVVERIMTRRVWTGQTAGMLMDALGPPEAVDVKLLKTKKKEIWKYAHQGGKRYGIRITLDNDKIVKADVKDEYVQKVLPP